jgi:hypothetical protein
MLGPGCILSTQSGGHVCGPMLPRSPSDLQNDFLNYYHGGVANFTNLVPVILGKTAGYTSVSASTFFPSNDNYFYSCWIQIESNIVVRVEIETSSKQTFKVAQKSLKTLKIRKKEILSIVQSSRR